MLLNEFFFLRMHQNRRRLGFTPDPLEELTGYSTPQAPLAGFKGAASRQEGNRGKDYGKGGGREGGNGEGIGKGGVEGE